MRKLYYNRTNNAIISKSDGLLPRASKAKNINVCSKLRHQVLVSAGNAKKSFSDSLRQIHKHLLDS